MTFKHGESYYLLFPWADGNLVDLWKSRKFSPTSLSDTRWLMKQCLGMAEGLWKIHWHTSWKQSDVNGFAHNNGKYRGRHGDIKPQNILWFEKSGDVNDLLVISDFGLTKFHSPDSVSKVANQLIGGYSPTYRAPELDLRNPISQKYDVWSLGCLYLEFLTWFLLGYQEASGNFVNARQADDDRRDGGWVTDKFFNLTNMQDGSLSASVKSSVIEWIARLRASNNCAECIRDFLDLIETELLVFNCEKRSKIDIVKRALTDICTKCMKSEEYCIPRAGATPSDEPDHLEPYDLNMNWSKSNMTKEKDHLTRHSGQVILNEDEDNDLQQRIFDELARNQEVAKADSRIKPGTEISGGGDLDIIDTTLKRDTRRRIANQTLKPQQIAHSDQPQLPRDDTQTTIFVSQTASQDQPPTAITTPSVSRQTSADLESLSEVNDSRPLNDGESSRDSYRHLLVVGNHALNMPTPSASINTTSQEQQVERVSTYSETPDAETSSSAISQQSVSHNITLSVRPVSISRNSSLEANVLVSDIDISQGGSQELRGMRNIILSSRRKRILVVTKSFWKGVIHKVLARLGGKSKDAT